MSSRVLRHFHKDLSLSEIHNTPTKQHEDELNPKEITLYPLPPAPPSPKS